MKNTLVAIAASAAFLLFSAGCAQAQLPTVRVQSSVAPPVSSSGRVLIQSDFSRLEQPFQVRDASRGVEVTGALPQGWEDNSAWQQGAKIRYEPVAFAGRRGVKITPQSATAQFRFRLKDFKGGERYRLQVTGRNPQQLEIKLAIRDDDTPYHSYWTQAIGLGDEWSKPVVDFTLGEVKAPVSLYVWVSGARGSAYLSDIKLTERTTQDILLDARRRFPDGGPQNLLRITRFPLGMQSGWSVGNIDETNSKLAYGLQRYVSQGQEAVINADSSTRGPSGAPALKFRLTPPVEGDLVTVFAEPFGIAQLDQPHTASLYLKGDGEGRIRVTRSYWTQLASVPFKIAARDGWKRFELPFTPGIEESVWNLRVEGRGNLWMDALQVEPNARATAYRSQRPFEVSLAREKGDASDAGISFADEPARFRWAVSGPPGTARLRFKVVFVDGTTRSLAPIALPQSVFLRTGTTSYNVLPGKPLGAFRIEAQVEDARGKPISSPNELLITRVQRPKYWGKDAPDSPFGTHLNNSVQNIRLAKAIGLNWVRLHDASAELVKWNSLEPSRGQWAWNDAGIRKFREQKMSILGVAQTTPPWAARAQGGFGYYDQYFLPLEYSNWDNYARNVLSRYQKDIPFWDVLNEPWGFGYLNEGYDTSASARGQYVRPKDEKDVYKRLSDGVRSGAKNLPGVRVTWDATRPLDWFMDRVREGSVKSGDVVDYHSYVGGAMGFPGDAAQLDAIQVRDSIRDAGRPDLGSKVRLWMTEGAPSSGRLFSGFYNVTLPTTYRPEILPTVIDNADQIVRFQASLLSIGVEKIFLYSMGREPHFGKDTTRWAVHVMEDGQPHPSTAAQSAFSFLIEDKKPAGTFELAPGVWAFLFSGKGAGTSTQSTATQSVAVLSPVGEHARYLPPTGRNLRRLDLWGNAISTAQPLGGRVEYVVLDGSAAQLKAQLQAAAKR